MPASLPTAASPAAAALRLAGAVLVAAVDRIHLWSELARQRRQLAGLSDHTLRDIGLTRADVEMEIRRPFWRVDGPARPRR